MKARRASEKLEIHRDGSRCMKVQPLTGAIGAEVTEITLSELDASGFADVKEAFLTHCMLVFPGQFLSVEAHMAFAAWWG